MGMKFQGGISGSYCTIAHNVNCNFAQYRFHSIWIRDSHDYSALYGVISHKAAAYATANGWMTYLHGTTKPGFKIEDSTGNYMSIESTTSINDGLWHWILIWMPTAIRANLYIDGSLYGYSENASFTGNTNTYNITLGDKGANGTNRPFYGNMALLVFGYTVDINYILNRGYKYRITSPGRALTGDMRSNLHSFMFYSGGVFRDYSQNNLTCTVGSTSYVTKSEMPPLVYSFGVD